MSDGGARSRDVPWESVVATLQAAAIMFFVVVNILNAFSIWQARWDHSGYLWLLLDSEGNPSTWFASILLLSAGVGALLCGLLDRRDHQRFWYLVGGLLVAMSFEEVAQVHELVSGNLRRAEGSPVAAAWVLPAGIGVVVVAVLVRAVAPRLEPRLLAGLLVGSALVVFGAFAFELVNSDAPLFRDEARDPRRVLIITTFEENFELVGAMILARTMVSHVLRLGRPRSPVATAP